VLIGDAACGKPFYLGSNLNWHFNDILPLADVTVWDAKESADHGTNLSGKSSHFKKYRETIIERNTVNVSSPLALTSSRRAVAKSASKIKKRNSKSRGKN